MKIIYVFLFLVLFAIPVSAKDITFKNRLKAAENLGCKTYLDMWPELKSFFKCGNRDSELAFVKFLDIYDIITEKIQEWDMDSSKGLVFEIIKRESGFREEICNNKFGCKSGIGLMQLIPSTNRYCEKQLGRKLNPKIAGDNLDCGLWLLKNEGISHWQDYSGPYVADLELL